MPAQKFPETPLPGAERSRVRRSGATHYLLMVIISFALTIAITRLFLELTGYPMIASGELHIAHVLWGGLILFLGALLPLLFANRSALDLSALFSGIGMGLFMDEVGKFITMNNDYHYPSAAPIIYIFFLLLVLLFLVMRDNRQEDPRAGLYAVLQALEEIVDRDLSAQERDSILARLQAIKPSLTTPDLAALVAHLETYLASDAIALVEHTPTRLERWQAALLRWEKRVLTRDRLRAALVAGLVALAAWSIYNPVSIFRLTRTPQIEQFFQELITGRYVRGSVGLVTFQINLGLQLAIGLVLLLTALLLALRRERFATNLGYLALMASLTIVNLLVFYFDQFSTILSASIQFLLFLGIVYYRRTYLDQEEAGPSAVG